MWLWRAASISVADLLGVRGIADQGADLIAAFIEEPGQLERDLSVPSGDDDSHGSFLPDGAGRARQRHRKGWVPQRMKYGSSPSRPGA